MGLVKWLTQDRTGEELAVPKGWVQRWTRPTVPIPRPGRRELALDIALALALSLPFKPFVHYTSSLPEYSSLEIGRGMALSIGIKMLIPLGMRRRFPLAALWVLLVGLPFATAPLPNVAAAVVVCSYSAAVYSPYRRLALLSPVAALVEVWALGYFNLMPGNNNLVIVPLMIPLTAALAFYGASVRRSAYADVGEQRRRRGEVQQEAIRRAVEDERSRIARELHDVVTHNVSVMVVMAGAARKVLERSPEQATEALLQVEAAGRAAMGELRQVMGLLTESREEQHRLSPEPGLDQMGTLVARIKATGVRIDYHVVGEPRWLSPGIDLTAYRVVQEALTNTVKHAVGAGIEILVEYKPALLVLDIRDSGGVPGQSASNGGGRGLIGLRERVAMHDGTVQAGRRPGGGYGVRVQIPLPAEDAV
jgi:signal transduction histidine kinase